MGFFRKIFGGGRKTSNIQLPAPPPVQDFITTIDELTGTKKVKSKDPITGEMISLVTRLPLSPEMQRLQDSAQVIMDNAIGEMTRLARFDPQQIVPFAPFVGILNQLNDERKADMQRLTQIPDFTRYVDEFKGYQRDLINREFEYQGNTLQEGLNRRGYGNSTAAAEMKAALAKEYGLAQQQADFNAQQYSEQLYDRDLQRRRSEYEFNELGRQGQLASAQAEYGLRRDFAADLEERRRAALAEQERLYGVAAGIKGAQTEKELRSMAPNLALAEFGAANNANMSRYNADVSRLIGQGNLNAQREQNRRPGVGQQIAGLGASIGSGMLFSSPSTVVGGWGQKLLGGGVPGADAVEGGMPFNGIRSIVPSTSSSSSGLNAGWGSTMPYRGLGNSLSAVRS